jgi:hypothetical protein
VVVPAVVVAQTLQHPTLVAVVPADKETQVEALSEAQHCCPVLVAVVVVKHPVALSSATHRLPLVAMVVQGSRYQPDGLIHQHHHQDGQQEAKRSLLVAVVVQTPQVAQVAHHLVVAMVVLDQQAQHQQQHPLSDLVVAVVV